MRESCGRLNRNLRGRNWEVCGFWRIFPRNYGIKVALWLSASIRYWLNILKNIFELQGWLRPSLWLVRVRNFLNSQSKANFITQAWIFVSHFLRFHFQKKQKKLQLFRTDRWKAISTSLKWPHFSCKFFSLRFKFAIPDYPIVTGIASTLWSNQTVLLLFVQKITCLNQTLIHYQSTRKTSKVK